MSEELADKIEVLERRVTLLSEELRLTAEALQHANAACEAASIRLEQLSPMAELYAREGAKNLILMEQLSEWRETADYWEATAKRTSVENLRADRTARAGFTGAVETEPRDEL